MYDNFEDELDRLSKPNSTFGGNIALILVTLFCIAIFILLIIKSVKIKNRIKNEATVNLESKNEDIGDKNFENKVDIEGLDTDFYNLIDNNYEKSSENNENIIVNGEDYKYDEDLETKINELLETKIANNNNKNNVEITNNTKNIHINEKGIDDKIGSEIVSSNKDGIKIQLGAMKSNEFAIEYKNNLILKYSDLFKDLDFFIKKVDLMEKGVFYRVQFGIFESVEKARHFCEKYTKISNNKLSSCIVVDD